MAEMIIDIVHEKNRSQGTTFLFSTHDERLRGRVDRCIHLRNGLIDDDERIAGES